MCQNSVLVFIVISHCIQCKYIQLVNMYAYHIYYRRSNIKYNVFTMLCTYLHLNKSKYYTFNVIICDTFNVTKDYYRICYILLNYITYILTINVRINQINIIIL